ncbi:MAG: hypothetical protein U5N26_08845 [Candidatus Marinimicrobia bacterium]|nr:hypothetical protein [Candidatus Neomarinimicrobiota bacterium]
MPLTTANASYRIRNAAQQYRESSYVQGNIYSTSLNFAYSFFKKGQLAWDWGRNYFWAAIPYSKDIAFETPGLNEVSIESDESFTGTQFAGGISVNPFPQLTIGAAYTLCTPFLAP